ncbi:MAG: Asp/Glu racemase [Alphaproteobacteria bacterium]|nr:Asp/Glu racemase [Alphaproteobacteria bacterium]
MPNILLINPNTTASITALVLRRARAEAAPGTRLRAVSGRFGARYVASRTAYAIAGHAAVDALARDRGRRDAVVLACFGDPGLAALKELAEVPVVGMAEAAVLEAARSRGRFSIVTGGERWKPMLEEFVAAMGLAKRLASVRTVAPSGADIARDPEGSLALLARTCRACAARDGAARVILGGAGLAGLAARLADRVEVPLIDGLAAAIARAEALVGRGHVPPGPPPVESVGLAPRLARRLAFAKVT